MNGILLVAIAALSLSGCGKFLSKFSRLDEGENSVRFVAKQQGLNISSLPGGIMVYAERTTDGLRKSMLLQDVDDPRSMQLPNGTYKFTAIGWVTAGLASALRCGFNSGGAPVALTGAPANVDVQIAMSTANCGQDTFGTSPVFRSGAAMQPLTLKFCGGAVNISAFTGAQNCNNTKESYRFIKGSTATNTGTDEAEIDAVAGNLIYTADLHAPSRREVFSVPFSGKGTVKLNPPSASASFSVGKVKINASMGKVFYVANQDVDSAKELYVATIGQPGSQKISGPITNTTTMNGIREFYLAKNGTYVVYAGEMENDDKVEVYSVRLSDGLVTKLSAGTSAGVGIELDGSDWTIKVSPNGDHVAFAGKFTDANKRDIYTAAVNGAAGSAVNLYGASANATFTVGQFEFTYDSQYVAWKGNPASGPIINLYRATVGSAGSSVVVNPGSPVAGANGRFYLSKNSNKIVFSADDTTGNYYNLYSADLSVASPFNVVVMHPAAIASGFAQNLIFNADSTKVAYFANIDADGGASNYKVYSATIGSASSQIIRNHTGSDWMVPSSGGGSDPIQITPTGEVVYRGSLTAPAGSYALYEFTLSNSGQGTLLSQNPAATKEVNKFSLGFGKAFFGYDNTADGIHQLFSAVLGGGAINFFNIFTGPLGLIDGVHVFTGAEIPPGLPNAIAIDGKLNTSAPKDIYILTDHSNPATLRKITRAYDHPNGVGRFKISLVEYKTDPGGNIVDTASGISSACLEGPSVDGMGVDLSTPGITFPAGNGTATSPFALAIDIYPEATDCSGSPSRILLPNGLAAAQIGPQAAKIRQTDNGSTPVLFIKD